MVTDLAGNKNKKGSTVKLAYDTKAPTFEITKNKGTITNEDVRFNFLLKKSKILIPRILKSVEKASSQGLGKNIVLL